MGNQFGSQRKVPYVLNVFHIVELHPLAVFLRNFFNILPVFATHHDVCNASTFGSQNLLLDTTDRQHFAAERDFSRHGGILAHLSLRQRRCYRRSNGDSCRRPVFRRSSFRHVYVQVPLFEDAIVDTQLIDMSFHIFQSDDRRLLHHVAEVTRQRQLGGFTLRKRSLDKKDFATHARPSQTRYHASIVVALINVAIERRLA